MCGCRRRPSRRRGGGDGCCEEEDPAWRGHAATLRPARRGGTGDTGRVARGLSPRALAAMWDAPRMPWVPELFSAPVLQQFLDRQQRDTIVDVPFFDGLVAGDTDALVGSFAGEPEVHHPV